MQKLAEKFIRYFRTSVKVKFTTLFLIGTIIPIIVLIYSIYGESRKLIRNKVTDYITNEMSILTNSLSNRINLIKNNMYGVLLQTDVLDRTNNRSLSPYESFMAGMRVRELLRAASPYTVTGNSLTFISRKGGTYDNGSQVNMFMTINDDFIQSIIDNSPEWIIESRNQFQIIPVPVITIGHTVHNKGTIIGVLIADIKYSALDAIIQQGTSNNGNVYLYDRKGQLVYSYGSLDLIGDIDPESLVNTSIIKKNGNRYLCVKYIPAENEYTSIALIPEREIYGDLFHFNLQSYMVILVLLLESMIFSLLVSNIVSRNIIDLSAGVEQFMVDSKPLKTSINSIDEIGRLSEGIKMMTSRIPELLQQVSDKESEKRHLEIRALLSQINPHMIYNTLNTITFLAQAQGISNIEEVSSSFALLMRITANIPGEFISIQQEMDYIRSYIKIKKYNLLIPLSIDIQVDEKLYDCKIPKLILQPFIENSIKHGFPYLSEEGIIQVKILEQDDRIHISISDNGCGIPQDIVHALLSADEINEENDTVGIPNTIRRLKLYYGDNFTIDIKSDSRTYTTIVIDIPNRPEEQY